MQVCKEKVTFSSPPDMATVMVLTKWTSVEGVNNGYDMISQREEMYSDEKVARCISQAHLRVLRKKSLV